MSLSIIYTTENQIWTSLQIWRVLHFLWPQFGWNQHLIAHHMLHLYLSPMILNSCPRLMPKLTNSNSNFSLSSNPRDASNTPPATGMRSIKTDVLFLLYIVPAVPRLVRASRWSCSCSNFNFAIVPILLWPASAHYTLLQTLDMNRLATFTSPLFTPMLIWQNPRIHHTLNCCTQWSSTVPTRCWSWTVAIHDFNFSIRRGQQLKCIGDNKLQCMVNWTVPPKLTSQ
jgi:hypothetical protein